MTGPMDIAKDLWLTQDLPVDFLNHLKFHGDPDTAINSSFKLGAIAQASIGLSGLASAYLHYLRTGVEQDVAVDARHACLEYQSSAYYTLDGEGPSGIWDPVAGIYPTKDRSFVRIHTNFPHHRRGILNLLRLPDTSEITRDQVAAAILQWNAEEFEREAMNHGMCASAYRSLDDWDKHPHAEFLVANPPLTITKIGNAPKQTLPQNDHPLQGIRVLDLSRVLAGPVAGRALAAHGADNLLITSLNLPALPGLDIDTSRGKPRSTAQHSSANLCAWSWEGPWKDYRGFDSLVQTATGLNYAEAEAYHHFSNPDSPIPDPLNPKAFPFQVLDYTGGYLLAFGTIVALCKSITEGGSYEVRVSLAGVGQYLRSLGRISPEIGFGLGKPLPPIGVLDPEVQQFVGEWKVSSGSGKKGGMVALKHPAVLGLTPCAQGEAPVVLNAHEAKWLESNTA